MATTTTTTATMKALEFIKSTGEIKIVEIPKPKPSSKSNLLVKVVAAAIDQGLGKIFPKGVFDGNFLHSQSSPLYLGWHYSGIVEEILVADTTADNGITVGTPVFGFLEYAPTQTQGSFSEYIVVSSSQCGIKPADVSFELAAASATECTAALQALRDCGRLRGDNNNKSVLICGATGGVGSAAIAIAKLLGATKVTAMCGNDQDAQSLLSRTNEYGRPDAVLNRSIYTSQGKDPIHGYGESFDIIFDCPSAFASYKYFQNVNPHGTFVVTTPTLGLMLGFLTSIFTFWTGKRVRMVLGTPKSDDFNLIASWLQKGQLDTIQVDSVVPVADMALAISQQSSRRKGGRVVIQVDGGWTATTKPTTEQPSEPKKEK